jgi:hypothetical protein
MVRNLERLCPYCGETTPLPRRAGTAIECACRQSTLGFTTTPAPAAVKATTPGDARPPRHLSNVEMNPKLDAREQMIVSLYMRRFASWSRVQTV